MKQLNISIKHNLIVGLLIALWLFVFAFIIKPFDDGTINFRAWFLISFGFSVMAFLCYCLLTILQRNLYKRISRWNISLEIASILLFYLIYFIGVYTFYKSSILKGGYNFSEFFSIIFIKVALILTPVIILARRYLIKLIPLPEDVITFRGENRLDVLKIKKEDLVCVSNAQNYVEIFYIENGKLVSKLIRSSLKKVQEDFDFLMQIHRSHLINPVHFKSWRNQNTIILTQIELPVSKNYKETLLAL
ncbi:MULTISPECIES: LytTR family DNA-binding domain-containing protein [unclassified Flavobacterium]|uniref:LytTR family DNA-binding domain-containing protein n=1 Tax=unclassified Flavobacterium TaxID=196869 RepID=UPI0012A83CD8|nr:MULTISPECIES: LytTR family DNA-binding domain-containing protein [unclassified Flavobacterium]MBF4486193.1 LytTR family transcriptional regulator DNA-binding domain-containing protein [Flavobacterium sp. CSZ]QGK76556.1 LytTR family transcriptional regulator [Flavobacterium sp. SLB02]